MATRAIGQALLAREAIGVDGLADDDDLEAVAEWAGARVRGHPAIRDLPGHQIGFSVWLSDGLERGHRRFVLAHELGHVRLGHSASLWTSPSSPSTAREEREADAFALVLLIGYPDAGFDERLREAAEAGVPENCLLRGMDALRRVGLR